MNKYAIDPLNLLYLLPVEGEVVCTTTEFCSINCRRDHMILNTASDASIPCMCFEEQPNLDYLLRASFVHGGRVSPCKSTVNMWPYAGFTRRTAHWCHHSLIEGLRWHHRDRCRVKPINFTMCLRCTWVGATCVIWKSLSSKLLKSTTVCYLLSSG